MLAVSWKKTTEITEKWLTLPNQLEEFTWESESVLFYHFRLCHIWADELNVATEAEFTQL